MHVSKERVPFIAAGRVYSIEEFALAIFDPRD
jgi:hypothetical protein